jgi:hypothetical protein
VRGRDMRGQRERVERGKEMGEGGERGREEEIG